MERGQEKGLQEMQASHWWEWYKSPNEVSEKVTFGSTRNNPCVDSVKWVVGKVLSNGELIHSAK